jgi:hypothetical protein
MVFSGKKSIIMPQEQGRPNKGQKNRDSASYSF